MSATPELVSVPLRDGTELRLLADINALCEFETEMARAGLDPTRELARIETGLGGTVSAVRALVWAFAKDRHPGLTLRHVGSLLGTDAPALRKGLSAALDRAAPEKEEGEAEDGEPDAEKPTPPD